MKFSVIIPVYNAGDSIRKCIDSVLAQTETDYEIIAVDDGSTDSTPATLDEIAEKHGQIRVIHQSNQGVSAARNKGILNAKGKYLVFIDSDDTVTECYLSSMLSVDADAVISDVCKTVNDTMPYSYKTNLKKITEDFSFDELCEMMENKAFDFCFAKRYRSDIVKEYGINFAVDLNLGEDTLFFAEYLTKCKSVAYTGTADYIYYTHQGSTLSAFNKSYVERLQDANIRIGNALEQRFPGIMQSKSFQNRQWSVFYYAIFYELKKSNFSRMEKYQLLRKWYSMALFKHLIENNEVFMINDPPLLRWIVRKRFPLLMIMYYDIDKMIWKRNKPSRKQ